MRSAPPSTAAAPVARTVENEDLPHGLTVQRAHGAFHLRQRWFSLLRALFLTPFLLVWNTMVFGYILDGGLPFPFWLTHGGAGLFLTYYWLALVVNKTTYSVSNGVLRVAHGPMPWWRNRELLASEIKQLFVEERRGQKGGATYELWVLRETGGPLALARGLATYAQAELIEKEIETVLGIEDRAVIHRTLV